MKLSASIVFVLVVSIALTSNALADFDSYGGLRFHPFTLNGCTEPTDGSHGHGNCDPVNLIFSKATPRQVGEALEARGWTVLGFGSTQFLHFRNDALVAQSVQLFFNDAFSERYHMRVWQGPGRTTVAAVHHEEGIFDHAIDQSWEAAESFVAGQLCPGAKTCGSTALLTQQSATQGDDGEWRGWANDARATVITLR